MGVTICCPGPIATGNDGKPRGVYGASGLVQQVETSAAAKKRLDPAATAAWIGAAAYHGLDEAWISRQPVLFLSASFRLFCAYSAPSAGGMCVSQWLVAHIAIGVREAVCTCAVCAAGYAIQYIPSVAKMVLMKIGPGRARALKSGGSGYDVKLFK